MLTLFATIDNHLPINFIKYFWYRSKLEINSEFFVTKKFSKFFCNINFMGFQKLRIETRGGFGPVFQKPGPARPGPYKLRPGPARPGPARGPYTS